ncbi:hypothetical protein CDL12_10342 [Handroanthus impetiginosus]|uniref:Uncharacterized protein n=1 Tax=Handroanthus impetiginosus TaxID=429701 RepID=A0A2G9HHU7_9LAMI|nr:hypothetical protein CDL12_10342 [Handroanthus impetiginosus]
MKEYENGSWTVKTFTRGEKGEGEVGCDTLLTSGFVSENTKLGDRVGISLVDSNNDAVKLPEDLKEAAKDIHSIIMETGVRTRGRLGKEKKGKIKLGVKDSSSNGMLPVQLKIENANGSSVSGTIDSAPNEAPQDGIQTGEIDLSSSDARRNYRDRFRNFARRNASRFAHFASHGELGDCAPDVAGREVPPHEAGSGREDWPRPFSTAMKIIKDHETNKNVKQQGTSSYKGDAVELKWTPKKQESCKCQKQVLSLQKLCLSILSKNADAITSLDFVPDTIRHKIFWFLCDNRRMDAHFLELLIHGSPTEIRVRDCSWLFKELFTKTFEGCNMTNLTVLQFDQCGSCMPDYTLYAALARSPNSLPALTTISLKGAYCRKDDAKVF